MACHTEGWLECRQTALAGKACLRRLAPGSACRQESKHFLTRTVAYDNTRLAIADIQALGSVSFPIIAVIRTVGHFLIFF